VPASKSNWKIDAVRHPYLARFADGGFDLVIRAWGTREVGDLSSGRDFFEATVTAIVAEAIEADRKARPVLLPTPLPFNPADDSTSSPPPFAATLRHHLAGDLAEPRVVREIAAAVVRQMSMGNLDAIRFAADGGERGRA